MIPRQLTVFYLFLLLISFTACNGSKLSSESNTPKFSFLKQNNPNLTSNINLKITDHKIKGHVPFDIPLDNLVATFEFDGVKVNINGVPQKSGQTPNNFKNILVYSIVDKEGDTSTYEADIVRFTGLPLVFITTEDSALIDSKEEYVNGEVSIIGGRYFDNLMSKMKIKGRGNSTWDMHPKKPYQLKFSNKSEVLGMPADKKWIFLAEYSDKTMLRNRTAFELGYQSNLNWTPESVFAEVIINGEYNGTYHITQKIEESKNRVNIGDDGYLLEIEQLHRLNQDDVYFHSSQFIINIKEPKTQRNDPAYNYISNYLTTFEVALYGNNFKDPDLGYAKYIDVDSFIDWYLINEISKNQDAKLYSSIYMNMVLGEKLKMGPIWDFDLGFGNVDYSITEQPEGFWVRENPWLKRLFEDQDFSKKVRERFAYYKENETHIMVMIDKYAAKLDRSQYENNQVWQTLGVYVWPNPVWFDTYGEEVSHLKRWISIRMNWLDANL
jgi:spore coat protein CotH